MSEAPAIMSSTPSIAHSVARPYLHSAVALASSSLFALGATKLLPLARVYPVDGPLATSRGDVGLETPGAVATGVSSH